MAVIHCSFTRRLITRSTTPTPTSHTLHRLVILDILSRNPTDTSSFVNVLLSLNAPQTAEILVSLLSPLGNEILIGIPLLQKICIQLFGDGLLLVIQLIDISRPLVMDAINVP